VRAVTQLRSRVPGWRPLLVPLTLFVLALVARAVAAAAVSFPASEDSAYYVAVARNLLEGRGLVSDAIWSYATPPLVLPKPAFELWMPMASFVSAIPMALFGHTFQAAQVGSVVLGALVAPLAWVVGLEAAAAAGLTGRRKATLAITAGLLAAGFGPFLVSAAVPDSTTSFLVFGVIAALLMPRALRADTAWPGVALGIALGLAYLSRSEAVWLGLTYLLLVWQARRRAAADPVGRGSSVAMRLVPAVVGGLVVVVPWLVRNALTFGSPFAGQAIENALITRNEQIFAWADRPSLAEFLGQGPVTIVGHQAAGLAHQFISVLLIPAFPVGLVGILALIALRRSPSLMTPTALRALLLSGLVTFLATGLLFPVATLWGTFLHSAGPLLCGLCVTAALGADALVARMRSARHWARENAWLAAAALLAVSVPLAAFEVLIVGAQSVNQRERISAVADAARNLPEVRSGAPIVSDHPVWLADALGVPVIALPDEPAADLGRLVNTFGAKVIVVLDERGRYPAALLSAADRPCTFGTPIPFGPTTDPAWSRPAWFVIVQPGCTA
jgi:hypothetical protein